VKAWWKARTRIRLAPALRTLSVVAVLIAVLFIPWQDRIFADGWVRTAQDTALHVPRAARMIEAPQPGPVRAEQVLAALDSSELQLRQARASTRIDTLDSRLAAAVVSDGSVADSVRSTRAQLAQQRQEAQGAGVEAKQLHLTSPFTGVLVDVAQDAVPGFVVSPRALSAARASRGLPAHAAGEACPFRDRSREGELWRQPLACGDERAGAADEFLRVGVQGSLQVTPCVAPSSVNSARTSPAKSEAFE